jgi:hypothetical protein
MARPRKEDTEKRLVQMNIRLTKGEASKVEELAASSGLSPANLVRYKFFSGRFPEPKQSPLDGEIYHELKKIGVNLNQATHKINSGEMPGNYREILMLLLTKLDNIFKRPIDDGQASKG